MPPPGPAASLDDWLDWQLTLAPREIDLGLERVSEVLDRLSLPRPPCVLTVAGTNGKGSCAVLLHDILRALGRKVGVYTSPHILRYSERIRVDGAEADAGRIVAAFRAVEAARRNVPLTYFEYGTLAAFVVFARAGVEAAVLEIGLGGRLDAVNVVDHDGCIITNVGMDHSDWLGDSLEDVAREKAAVMRAGKPAIYGAPAPPAPPAPILAQASACGADLAVAGRDFRAQARGGGRWRWQGRDAALDDLPLPALRGRHQLDNAAAVLALIEALGLEQALNRDLLAPVLEGLRLAGRQQLVAARQRRWLLDGAHNEDGAMALAATLGALEGGGPRPLVLGLLADKDAEAIVAALAPAAAQFFTCTPPAARALAGEALRAVVERRSAAPARACGSVEAALAAAHAATATGDLIVVAGSFYTLGAALCWLGLEMGAATD